MSCKELVMTSVNVTFPWSEHLASPPRSGIRKFISLNLREIAAG